MGIPSRDALLDIDWLTRTEAAEGTSALIRCLRRGAETYDGPVTGIAEALNVRCRPAQDGTDHIDLAAVLGWRLHSGSWTTAAGGPVPDRVHDLIWMMPAEKRTAFLAEVSLPADVPPLPDLHHLRLIEPLDRAWVGHTEGIWGCDVSKDGRYAVSASRDGDVAVWDMERGTLVARATTGEPEVRDCVIAPDGERVISVHASGRITVWQLRTMALVAAFDAPPRTPHPIGGGRGSSQRWRRVAISPDGSHLAVAGTHAVDLWDLETCTCVTRLTVETDGPDGLFALDFRSDDVLTGVGRADPSPVLTWDLHSRRVIDRRELPQQIKKVQRAMVTPNHQFFVAASWHETTVWRLDTCAAVGSVPHGIAGQALAISPDGRLAATSGADLMDGSDDRRIRLWSLPDLREIRQWSVAALGCRDLVCALTFTPDARHLVLGDWHGVLRRLVLPDVVHDYV